MTDVYRRDGKHPIAVGDRVRVAANPDSPSGETGWRHATVVEFYVDATSRQMACVTKPRFAGVRQVAATRLTKQHR